jgi:hypothetical protein
MFASFMEDNIIFASARADLLSTLSSTTSGVVPWKSPSSRASQTHGGCIILCFPGRHSHHTLLYRLLADQVVNTKRMSLVLLLMLMSPTKPTKSLSQ